ncbi:MAG: protein of unknown function DUF5104 [Podoviridae sp. ctQNx1]|nr:MAG: protein of unknown function DUF5104 [Podoviridae sp. ctQNx1]UOF78150.1 hypothetical protein [Caudoviricetes sp.]
MDKFPSVKVGGEKISFPTKEEVQLEVIAQTAQLQALNAKRYEYLRAAFCKDMKKTHEEFDSWVDEEMKIALLR